MSDLQHPADPVIVRLPAEIDVAHAEAVANSCAQPSPAAQAR
jgi:hypothetical protein